MTFDKTTGKPVLSEAEVTTFVTYMGGDGYSSSVIYHNEQTTSTTAQYLYLHRDYLAAFWPLWTRPSVKERYGLTF